MSSKKSPYKIKISNVSNVEMGTQSIFSSRAKFGKSDLCDFLRRNDSSGKLKVDYGNDYNNVGLFSNFKELNALLDVFLEKELLDDFTKE